MNPEVSNIFVYINLLYYFNLFFKQGFVGWRDYLTILYYYIEELLTNAVVFEKCEFAANVINRIVNPEDFPNENRVVTINSVIKDAVRVFAAKSVLIDSIKSQINEWIAKGRKKGFPTLKVKSVIREILKDDSFKVGAKYLELDIDLEISEIIVVKNLNFLLMVESINKTKDAYEKFERYTLDAVKELPLDQTVSTDPDEIPVEYSCRILKHDFNVGRINPGNLTLDDIIGFERWVENRAESFEGLTTDFNKTNVNFKEGNVYIGRRDEEKLYDITSQVRQISKEFYEKLIENRGM